MTDGPTRRSDDIVITELATKFDDFVDRYERDQRESKEWRDKIGEVLRSHDDFIKDLAPNYKRGMWVLGLVTIGAIGYIIKSLFSHIKWG